ncbi:MAG: hypothetical protein M1812_002586 [Candelaria pacifica]|nr:MAG: hypothetical protein M1812_002586 [Candelaria pacifica]
MGGSVSRILSGLLWTKKEIRILILGLDNAGKTTLLYRLKVGPFTASQYSTAIGEVVTTIPTIGFNVESVTYQNLNFNVWDLGGQTSIRPYWRCYYANTAAVIFVIDSTDIERIGTASEELAAMLNEDELKDAALLVFANKQDQPGAKGAGEISEALRLGELRDRNWSIVACSAVDGRGVNEGMDWLVYAFERRCLQNDSILDVLEGISAKSVVQTAVIDRFWAGSHTLPFPRAPRARHSSNGEENGNDIDESTLALVASAPNAGRDGSETLTLVLLRFKVEDNFGEVVTLSRQVAAGGLPRGPTRRHHPSLARHPLGHSDPNLWFLDLLWANQRPEAHGKTY